MAYTLFVILIVIAALLMIGIVLIQESKGGGLASNFSSSNQIMGVRKTTDVIEKTTWALAASMVIFSVICAYVAPTASTEQSVLERTATETQTTSPINTQGFGAGEQTTPTTETAPATDAAAPAEAPAAPAEAPAEAPKAE
ncbi:MAG: preprotein translocase subunit SecG [Prevotella sp.]|nr:preprotein translocase subunit SecG [Prevotella sp.]MBR7043947.1 preprotein translocase subunit SecG [Prevotella sp.]MBR7085928.1 preprotein translocase subunit SecG [Prevotella sp.]